MPEPPGDPANRRVVSVSLGSPSRDWTASLAPLGFPLTIERRGVGSDYVRYAAELRRLADDPTVAAIGIGGINRYLFSGERAVPLRRAEQLVASARGKPACDGAALKRLWEPEVVRRLDPMVEWRGKRVLMVCAVDRWGMAATLDNFGAELALGDLMFALGVPFPLRSLAGAERLTRLLLPVISRAVPFEWLYPTGESRDVPKYRKWYDWADILAGDWKFIRKHMPDEAGSLTGKIVLTNTTTSADVETLRHRGARLLVTTTPVLDGRSFGANAIEAAVCALTGRGPHELTLDDFLGIFRVAGWDRPRVLDLTSSES